jgi:thiamine biosynthesis lipoprotein
MADERDAELRRAQPWLGTLVEIAAAGPATIDVEAAIAAAFEAVARVHHTLSAYDEASELVRVNRAASRAPQRASPLLREVLVCALDVAAHSDGAFDPTVGGTVAAWGFLPRRGECAARSTWRDVVIDGDDVRFARPLALDFDGIAKGYAVDCAIAALAAAGVTRGRVNAGGDLRVFGPRAETIVVRTGGAKPVRFPLVTLSDAALATSAYAGQRRCVDHRYATPLVEPRSRLPVMSTRTVSVVAPTCMLADALTKVVALRGPRAAATLVRYGACATMLSPARGAWRATRVPRMPERRAA